MVRKKNPTNEAERLLTAVELELMTVIWRLGGGTVRDVMAALPQGQELAYTSVSTILRILEQKGVLASRKDSRTHVYEPRLTLKDYQERSVRHVVDTVFSGAPTALVRGLLDADMVSEAELDEIRKLLEQRAKS